MVKCGVEDATVGAVTFSATEAVANVLPVSEGRQGGDSDDGVKKLHTDHSEASCFCTVWWNLARVLKRFLSLQENKCQLCSFLQFQPALFA